MDAAAESSASTHLDQPLGERRMQAATLNQTPLPLDVLTPLGQGALFLVGFAGQEGISQLFRFELDLLADNRREVAFDKLLGQPVSVRLTLGGARGRNFNGIVSRFSQGTRDHTFTRYQAEVV